MPCIFCIAVFMLVAGALTAEQLDEVEGKLADKADGGRVRRSVDSDSVARFELTVKVGSKAVPVAVTVFKEHRRIRIQVLSHDLDPQEVEELEDELAEALDAEIVDRQDGSAEVEDHEHPEAEEERVPEREGAADADADAERTAERGRQKS
jgi:hypothetical protein